MRLFGRGGVVTAAMLQRAVTDVRAELTTTRLATPRLERVRITRPWLQLSDRVGFYVPGGPGLIGVPAVSLGRVAEYRREAPWTAVRDILRHEFAHALADLHPAAVETREFESVFGGSHDSDQAVVEYGFHTHVSEYAASMPSEDFAETVMVYLRSHGRIERFARRPVLHRKLRYVAMLPRVLARERAVA